MTRKTLCPNNPRQEVVLPITVPRLGVTYDWCLRHKTTISKQSSQIWIPRKQGLKLHGPDLPPASHTSLWLAQPLRDSSSDNVTTSLG